MYTMIQSDNTKNGMTIYGIYVFRRRNTVIMMISTIYGILNYIYIYIFDRLNYTFLQI